MLEDLNALAIMAFHDRQLANTGLPVSDWAEHTRGIWHWIELDHAHNRLLWAAQRKAECASGLTQPNDAVDDYREKRRNAQEAIDDCVLAGLRHVALRPGARVSSETVSSLIDRLSRLSLRIHRARENRCGEEELARLTAQRAELGAHLDGFLREALKGRAYYKVYRDRPLPDELAA